MPLLRLSLSSALACALAAPLAAAAPAADPNAYLEEVEGTRALAKVREWNAAADAVLEKEPGFAAYRERALALLQDDAQIAVPDRVIGDRVLNLWRDKAHVRGLWRVASLASFAAGKPEWRTLIDIDALGRAEGRSWVWGGADCRAPDYARCIVTLSDGGGDAAVRREFDMASGRFVADGFVLPAAKSATAWAGPDALYVTTDFGPGSLTSSGYGRIVKLWRRGTPLSAATTVAEAEASDVSIRPHVFVEGEARWPVIARGIDFYRSEVSHVAPDGRLVRSPLPIDAEVEDVLDGHLFATLASPWQGHPAGAIVEYAIADVLAGRTPVVRAVMVPGPSQAIEQVAAGKAVLWVKLLDDVSGKLVALRQGADGAWAQQAAALPANATIHLEAAAGREELAFATVEGMLTPPTLYAVRPGAAPAAVQALPARFDASKMEVTQRFATSKDGTKVPYFLVRKPGAKGRVPALIHAYGGFRLAQTPTYLTGQPYRSGPAALFWVEEGNAYVLANIRGGGEYGPAWHQAALREKRQNAYDDFHAVAEDLIAAGISAKGRIAASGRSNGGLLVGVLMTQRPDLYGAIIMGSPLTDMKRYSHLLAGASWMGEYGDPDKPEDWAFIERYSPYQKLAAGVRYPKPFIYTSTKDDRVHPGHARKFAAKLKQLGDGFYYSEAIEGGHAAGADRLEDARRAAMVTVYLNKELGAAARD
ncbi:prolyl oligopeptidase family serine peptidase [Sphingomonas flavalba]|uniref:prolyl oligopeptidase family serine peptidase n=1 Tax=Sphingomonas flavalba TaxID=2559804 RepID=UPI00109DA27F|nr:prolyl oligopeptidase family serine peptidase [Sphingomonas flavalba]